MPLVFNNGLQLWFDNVTVNKTIAKTTGTYNYTYTFTAFPNNLIVPLYSLLGGYYFKHSLGNVTTTTFIVRVGNDGASSHTLEKIYILLIGY